MFIDTCFYVDLMREHSKGIVGPAKKKFVMSAAAKAKISAAAKARWAAKKAAEVKK